MDNSTHKPYVAVSEEHIQAHLRRVVAKRIDRVMQQARANRVSRHSAHTNPANCDCDECDGSNCEAA